MAIDNSKTPVPQQTDALVNVGKQLRLKKKILSARDIAMTVDEIHAAAAGDQPSNFLNFSDLELKIRGYTGTKSVQKNRSHQEIQLDFVDSLSSPKFSLNFCFVPSGKFTMGGLGWWDEVPIHRVTISHDLYLGKFPVTQAQWDAVMGGNSSMNQRPFEAVRGVSWDDCQEFIRRLNISGKGAFRLPTGAEWEYACQAGTGSISANNDSHWGDDYAWFFDNDSVKKNSPKTKQNPWGLYDMLNTVWEWCQDWSGKYSTEAVIDPQGPTSGSRRKIRGGPWFDDIRCRHEPYRSAAEPDCRGYDFGFRLVYMQGCKVRSGR